MKKTHGSATNALTLKLLISIHGDWHDGFNHCTFRELEDEVIGLLAKRTSQDKYKVAICGHSK